MANAPNCVLQRGALIVLEGCDRSGKSTQCRFIIEYLTRKGLKVEALEFPERTSGTGKLINQYLTRSQECSDQAIHLLFSSNRWEYAEKMRRKLVDGITLVIDRYAFSGVAFTAAKKCMSLEWCMSPDRGLPRPDLVVFLDSKPERSAQRAGFGEERYENIEFQSKVYDVYQKLMTEKGNHWKRVQADQPKEAVSEVVRTLVDEVLEICARKPPPPIAQLWVEEETVDQSG
ncbi:unnamed protein product [Cyprideis torosa]|uniref:Thymidylate kinase n=1 Tax=Cyprideis torosa TaxID=163714 RepID=A0A7R8ZLC4_9CRUS|nr:unnamed protein product [Cyprideis torosa]CAG0881967.1 unnamed protein product [Cyprideis torosa]